MKITGNIFRLLIFIVFLLLGACDKESGNSDSNYIRNASGDKTVISSVEISYSSGEGYSVAIYSKSGANAIATCFIPDEYAGKTIDLISNDEWSVDIWNGSEYRTLDSSHIEKVQSGSMCLKKIGTGRYEFNLVIFFDDGTSFEVNFSGSVVFDGDDVRASDYYSNGTLSAGISKVTIMDKVGEGIEYTFWITGRTDFVARVFIPDTASRIYGEYSADLPESSGWKAELLGSDGAMHTFTLDNLPVLPAGAWNGRFGRDEYDSTFHIRFELSIIEYTTGSNPKTISYFIDVESKDLCTFKSVVNHDNYWRVDRLVAELTSAEWFTSSTSTGERTLSLYGKLGGETVMLADIKIDGNALGTTIDLMKTNSFWYITLGTEDYVYFNGGYYDHYFLESGTLTISFDDNAGTVSVNMQIFTSHPSHYDYDRTLIEVCYSGTAKELD